MVNRVSEEAPSWCHRCNIDVPPEHWFWQKGPRYRLGGTWRCVETKRNDNARYHQRVDGDPVRRSRKVKWQDERYEDEYNRLYIRWKAYRTIDRARGVSTIERDPALLLMREPCFYCKMENSGGLDRKDNSMGHCESNVRPCCMVCNNILTDLPLEAKDVISMGLEEARKLGYLDTWIPPIHRKAIAKRKERLAQSDRPSTTTLKELK